MFSINDLFTKEELSTMTVIDPQRKCPICHQQCGTIFIPKECSCLKMCGNCLDDFYDSRHMSTKKRETSCLNVLHVEKRFSRLKFCNFIFVKMKKIFKFIIKWIFFFLKYWL